MIPDEIREQYGTLCEAYKVLHRKMRKLKGEYGDFFKRGVEFQKKAISANNTYLELKKTQKGGYLQLQDMEKKLLEIGDMSRSFMVGLEEFKDDNIILLDKIHDFQDVIKRAGEELVKGKTNRKQMVKEMDKLEKGFENVKQNYKQCNDAFTPRNEAMIEIISCYEDMLS
ncbi:MAG: hypothetical protein E3I52_05835 [Candidatus Aminicenantes bacterium]|nr:MAG: hypothetical protein E3I52_05835 [Candidatus Aminicenantes bacterium]